MANKHGVKVPKWKLDAIEAFKLEWDIRKAALIGAGAKKPGLEHWRKQLLHTYNLTEEEVSNGH